MNHVLVVEHSLKAGILYTTVKVCSKQGSLRHQGSDCQIIRIHCCDRNSFSRICYNQLIRNHSRRYWALIWIIISILFGLSFVGQTIKLRFKFLQSHSVSTTIQHKYFSESFRRAIRCAFTNTAGHLYSKENVNIFQHLYLIGLFYRIYVEHFQ